VLDYFGAYLVAAMANDDPDKEIRVVDLPAAVLACGEAAGLVPYERNVALLAGLRDDQLVPRASFFAIDQARRARERGERRLVIAHEDLLVLRSQ
jgi:modification methylase